MSVLRRAYVPVEPDVDNFDQRLREKFARLDPGGKAGKQLGGQLNRALKRLDLDPVDVRADPKKALAAIEVTEAKLKALSRSASTVEIKVRAEEGLREIGRFRKKLGDEGEASATGFVAKFAEKLKPQMENLLAKLPVSGPVAAAIGGAAVAVAPLLGAAVAGAIIGGAGVGGVVGGLKLASKDARVQAAAEAVGARLEARLNRAAGSFVKPAIDGLGQVEQAIGEFDFDQVFRDSARYVPALTKGVSDALGSIGDGLEVLIGKAGPVVDAFGASIASIGAEVGAGFKLLAGDADSGALAIKDLTDAVNNFLRLAFVTLHVLSEINAVFDGATSGVDKYDVSIRRVAGGAVAMSAGLQVAADNTELLKEQQDGLKAAQDAVKVSQDALNSTLESLGGKNTFAARTSDALRTAMDSLYGASIRNTDANEAYEASWDELSKSVKANGGSLNIHSAAGRANRDVLQSLLTKSGELYVSNVAAGESIDSARRKHEKRTEAVKEEARKLGFNKDETQKLITTYGRIPGKKTTDLVLDGVREVVNALTRLYIYQRALAEGKSISSIEQTIRTGSDKGPSKRGGGYHEGGWTGPGDKMQPAGIVHADEFVIRKESRRKLEQRNPGLLRELNATGQLPGHAAGGRVAPVDTSRRWPFHTDVGGTRVPSKSEVASKVAVQFGGNWPSSPSAQRGDSGIWRKVLALARSSGLPVHFGNGYRPGDPLWHGSGRADDLMGYNQDALANFFLARQGQILEMIHRTDKRDYAYTRGKNKGSFNEALMQAHRNHLHIAMANGGVIREPVFGVGASGASYSFGEGGRPETVTPGVVRPGGGGGSTINVTINAAVGTHPAEIGRQVVTAIKAYEQGNGTGWRA